MSAKFIDRNICELAPVYDRAKSFYGKAHVVTEKNGDKTLYSYTTPVASVTKSGDIVRHWHGYSVTTMRHVNDFAYQYAAVPGRVIGKAAWDALPVVDYKNARYWI